jgi:hypothetical protein
MNVSLESACLHNDCMTEATGRPNEASCLLNYVQYTELSMGGGGGST